MKITIEATINATPEKVWSAWTTPNHITKWNYATDDWQCPHASNDLKVGGKYCARMEAKDASMGFDFVAIYDEVEAMKKLAYTMADGRKVETVFVPSSEVVTVTTVFDAENENSVEMQKQGWQSILNNFKKYVESI
ncbi:MAG: SRPBCC family protein [Deltaproteobacteria bacterium]|nr:SRPBCC family protein [Deltaproteobacteria bacterium]